MPLFSVVNPIGMSAVFLTLTKSHPAALRHQYAYRVAIYGFALLVTTFFIGPYILIFFGISLYNIQFAGGMILFYTAWNMLDTKPKISTEEQKEALVKETDICFFPLTMPITAGAGSMAITITLATKPIKGEQSIFLQISAALIAILVVFIIVGLCYRYADTIFKKLGHTGTNVVTRLTAFILLAISINVAWNGLVGMISAIP